MTTTPVPTTALTIVSGEEHLTRHIGRFFCRLCGARLFNRAEELAGVTALIVTSLDQEPEAQPIMHINVESKAPWYEILDTQPQHEGFAPGMMDQSDGRQRQT